MWMPPCAAQRQTKNPSTIFAAIFEGGPGGDPALKTYTFDDIVSALNAVAPYDWKGFLRTRLDDTAPKTPVESVENSGWKIVYNDRPNEY